MKVQFRPRKATNPEYDKGISVLYGPAKRLQSRLRWYFILLLVTSPILYFLGRYILSFYIVSVPGIIYLDEKVYRAPLAGKVKLIEVDTFQKVNKGQKLIELSQIALEQEADLLSLEYDLLKQKQIEGVKQIAEQRLKHVEENYKAVKELFSLGAVTRAELNQAADQYISQLQTVSAEKTRSNHQVLLLKQQHTKSMKEKLLISAEESGQVTSIEVTEGEFVSAGLPLLKIRKPLEAVVIAWLPPTLSDYAQLGYPVKVLFPNGDVISGEVSGIPELAVKIPAERIDAFHSDRLGIPVYIKMNEEGLSLPLYHNFPIEVRFPFNLHYSI